MSAVDFDALTPEQVDAYRGVIRDAPLNLDDAREILFAQEVEWLELRKVPAVWRIAGEAPSEEGIRHFAEQLLAEAPHLVEHRVDSGALWELMKAKNNIEARTLLTGLLAVLEHDQGAT